MIFNKKIYNIVTTIVVLLSITVFSFHYFEVFKEVFGRNPLSLIVSVLTMSAVLIIKYIRLYFIFYGLNVGESEHIKLFSLTTFVNLFLPFKLGDIFRCYCYGYAIGNYVQGFCYIMLDRFMDTLALVTALGCLSIIYENKIPLLLFLLIAFLTILIFLYFLFPGLYGYWNKYFLKSTATKRKLSALHIIKKSNEVYTILKENIRGKGIILYLLSLVAWAIESTGFWIIANYPNSNTNAANLFMYLRAALGIGTLREQELFMIACAVISALSYICLSCNLKIRRIKK